MSLRIVFDAYAILAVLENETGAQIVAEILTNKQKEIFLSVINLGEVYYILLKRNSDNAAEEVLESIFMEEALTVVEAPWQRVKKAAKIKSEGGLSYADAFALALAKELQAPLVTGDPEIKSIAPKYDVEIIWLD
jgi:predicted nucleic acid-binding protein